MSRQEKKYLGLERRTQCRSIDKFFAREHHINVREHAGERRRRASQITPLLHRQRLQILKPKLLLIRLQCTAQQQQMRTLSCELLMKPCTRSKSKSVTRGTCFSHGSKLKTCERGSCSQYTPGLQTRQYQMGTCILHATYLKSTRSNPCASRAMGLCSLGGAKSSTDIVI